jgi:hypothetical protein
MGTRRRRRLRMYLRKVISYGVQIKAGQGYCCPRPV